VNAVSGKLARKAMEVIAEYAKVNFVTQVKEAIQHGIFGYSWGDVEKWVFGFGDELERCAEFSHGSKNYCWINMSTVKRYAWKNGPRIEFPNFDILPEIEECGPGDKRGHCTVPVDET
jgi:hypothetical protein